MAKLTLADWQQRAANLKIEGRAFIDGQYVNAISGKTTTDINPANGQKLADIACCGPEDAEVAVKVARRTFESGVWSKMAPGDRKKVIVKFADLLEQHHEELALLESLDCGKPIANTLAVDSMSAVKTMRW